MQSDIAKVSVRSKLSLAERSQTSLSLVTRSHSTIGRMIVPVLLIVFPQSVIFAPMHMSRPSRRKEHLYSNHDQDRRHGDQACHSRITAVPETRQTWIREGDERGGEEMNKGRSNEHTCAEMSRKEEEVVRDRQTGKATHDDGE